MVSTQASSVAAEGVGKSPALGALRLASIAVQVALVTLIVRIFHLESDALFEILALATGAFVVHSLLPMGLRMPFFAWISLAGMALILGPINAAWILGLGLGLIGICHLPTQQWIRVILLLVAGAFLTAFRADWLHFPGSPAIWTIFGSMFMFRLIIYLYDLPHEKVAASPWRTLSYFFMLPNTCFPLFPAVDYKTFRRTYYGRDALEIYQNGVRWMSRGVTQLVIYRVVYYYFVLSPSEIAAPGDLAQYILANFALYLRVSGQFHLIVGMLQLFGFDLPESHRRYYIASTFNDFWRRINIYWKDFMMKIFYYPMFFRLRKRGGTFAMVVATLMVFVLTWLLHSYQWFWLRGKFPLLGQDLVFWGVLGLLVVINSLWEARHGRKRSLKKKKLTLRDTMVRGLSSVAVFTFMAVLWSLWTSETIGDWAAMWPAAARGEWITLWWLLPLLFLVGLLGGLESRESSGRTKKSFSRSAFLTAAPLLVLLVLGIPAVQSRIGGRQGEILADVSDARLSRLDAQQLEVGYYEQLMRVDRFNSQLWELYNKEEKRGPELTENDIFDWSDDFLKVKVQAGVTASYLGKRFTTNRWAMRDRDYELERPQGTYRIALIGTSHVMGHGVADDQVFEAIVEERFRREGQAGSVEILNFALSSYSPLQQIPVLEEQALRFDPQAVFYVGHSEDIRWTIQHLAERARMGVEMPYPELARIVAEAGIDESTPATAAEGLLRPFSHELMVWTYGRIVEICREDGILPVYVFMPKVKEYVGPETVKGLLRLASEAGFTILNLRGVYSGHAMSEIQVSQSDHHPNQIGHALVADRLYEEMIANREAIGLPTARQ